MSGVRVATVKQMIYYTHHRPHSSGSAQFCGILGERLLAPVSDEKKHEAIAAAPPAEATAETRAEA